MQPRMPQEAIAISVCQRSCVLSPAERATSKFALPPRCPPLSRGPSARDAFSRAVRDHAFLRCCYSCCIGHCRAHREQERIRKCDHCASVDTLDVTDSCRASPLELSHPMRAEQARSDFMAEAVHPNYVSCVLGSGEATRSISDRWCGSNHSRLWQRTAISLPAARTFAEESNDEQRRKSRES